MRENNTKKYMYMSIRRNHDNSKRLEKHDKKENKRVNISKQTKESNVETLQVSIKNEDPLHNI